jgi:4-hydroxy-3-methylbut-2-en-1-yl diphosphate reductase
MSNLLIAAPLRLEAIAISSGISSHGIGSRPPARVHRTGMGPRRARAAAPRLLNRPGAALVVMGFGGGLDEHSDVGDVVVADAVQGPDGERVACAGAQQLTEALERHGLRVRSGTVASVARIAMGDARVQLREAGAIAVDMESVWLAPGAGDRPFAVVRAISDTPTRELTNPLRTVAGVARAMATLRRAAGALHEWAPEGLM